MATVLKTSHQIPVHYPDGGGNSELVPISSLMTLMNDTDQSEITTLQGDMATAEGRLDDIEDLLPETGAPLIAASATLTTGADDSEIDWTVDVKGALGNSYTLTFEVPATSKLIPASGGDTYAMTYTGVKGQHPISIVYADGAANTTVVVTKGAANDFTVTIGTNATALDLYNAVIASIASGVMAGKISGVVKHASWSDAANPSTMAQDWLDAAAAISVTGGTDLVATVKYDGETDAATSTATEMLTAVNLWSSLVTGVATGTGADPVEEMTETAFEDGVTGTIGLDGEMRYSATALWICVDSATAITTNSAGWKYITFTG